MMEIVDSSNGAYEIHDKYVIARYFEGSSLGIEEAVFVNTLLRDRFSTEFGWISDRVNSYSTDPMVIKEMVKNVSHFKCAAWVSYGSSLKAKASVLPAFVPDRIKTNIFDSLPEAIEWVESIVE